MKHPRPKSSNSSRLRAGMALALVASTALVLVWFQVWPATAGFDWEEAVKGTASDMVRDTQPGQDSGRNRDAVSQAASAKIWENLPRQVSSQDKNGNGINDTDDIIEGARLEAGRKPIYQSAYYVGGYPPETEGVCTDVIWRAFQHAGYDLKAMMDADIKANIMAYPRTRGKPDRHIDFRRVPNQLVFFQRHALSLTKELKPGDYDNLIQWQPGDIVTFRSPDHIAILSTIRNAEGVPYLIHNDGPWASEDDGFPSWAARGITGHFRFPHQ